MANAAQNKDLHFQRVVGLCQQGRFRAALHFLRQATDLDRLPRMQFMSWVLSQIDPDEFKPELEQDLLACLSIKDIDCQPLAWLISQQLLYKSHLPDFFIDQSEQALRELSVDPLWMKFLSRVINVNPHMEAMLASLRRKLLFLWSDGVHNVSPYMNFIAGVAVQCDANEFIFSCSSDETALVDQTVEAGKLAAPGSNLSEQLCAAMVVAMYRPLIDIEIHEEIVSAAWDRGGIVAELVTRTLFEPRQEKDLRDTIPRIAPVKADVSLAVQRQYEESPYPRWRCPPPRIGQRLAETLLKFPGVDVSRAYTESTLVAGCGTGYEPIGLATNDPDLNITAVDLSRASLAFAWRSSEALGISNVSFLEGDILDLPLTNRRFFFVSCTGVLHHMADPLEGWRSLCEVTLPGGVQRISLYSQHARRRVHKARALIADLELAPTLEGVKQLRQYLLDGHVRDDLAALLQSSDFYTYSGCRDLLFHVQEHCFTLPQLAEVIPNLGLTLLKLEIPNEGAYRRFRNRWGEDASLNDLAKWDQLEEEWPDTFSGMYTIWVQKPPGEPVTA